jgi:hypothetical protein
MDNAEHCGILQATGCMQIKPFLKDMSSSPCAKLVVLM